jgi:hypothetical protein
MFSNIPRECLLDGSDCGSNSCPAAPIPQELLEEWFERAERLERERIKRECLRGLLALGILPRSVVREASEL